MNTPVSKEIVRTFQLEDAEKMDEAAERAKEALPKIKTAEQLAEWVYGWYKDAGYKRLCRAMIAYYQPKEKPAEKIAKSAAKKIKK